MLYRGSEIMREVAWVIFDEIHYMRDASKFKCLYELYRENVDLCFFLTSPWCCLGRDHHSAPRQGSLRVPVCDNSKRDAICRMDRQTA